MCSRKNREEKILNKAHNPHPCVLCGGTDFSLLFSAPDFDNGEMSFQLTRCTSCNLVRTEPILVGDELEKYYSLPYYGSGKSKFIGVAEALTYCFNYSRAFSILSHLRGRQMFPVSASSKILDIGCGRGNLLKILKKMGCDCYGIERREFPMDDHSRGIHFYKEKLEDLVFTENFFDVAIIWHVLEHIDNPASIVQETARILRPGGILAVAVPNFGSFQAMTFQESWFHLDLPRHRYHFSSDTLLRILNQYGFSIINQHTFSIEQNPFGFIQSLFNKVAPSSKFNRFYSLIKRTGSRSSVVCLIMWTFLGSLIFPFAFLEYLISGMSSRGATFVVYAKKC